MEHDLKFQARVGGEKGCAEKIVYLAQMMADGVGRISRNAAARGDIEAGTQQREHCAGDEYAFLRIYPDQRSQPLGRDGFDQFPVSEDGKQREAPKTLDSRV